MGEIVPARGGEALREALFRNQSPTCCIRRKVTLGGDAGTRRHGDAESGLWFLGAILGWFRNKGCVSVVTCSEVVKDQGGRLLTGVGGGAEDGGGLGGLLH
jgi:hypothetical protein